MEGDRDIIEFDVRFEIDEVGLLVIYYVCHVDNFVVVMGLQRAQVQIVIVELVEAFLHLGLDVAQFLILLVHQLLQLALSLLLEGIHHFSDLRKVLLQLILYYLTIATLHALEVLESLVELVSAIKNHNPSRLYILLYVFYHLWYYLYQV